jgi:hypothetical protein
MPAGSSVLTPIDVPIGSFPELAVVKRQLVRPLPLLTESGTPPVRVVTHCTSVRRQVEEPSKLGAIAAMLLPLALGPPTLEWQ